jgi:hypothetical protein
MFTHTASGRLHAVGFCGVSRTVVPTPAPSTPYVLKSVQYTAVRPAAKPATLAYSATAAAAGKFPPDRRSAGYIPALTAEKLKKIKKQEVIGGLDLPSDTIVVDH